MADVLTVIWYAAALSGFVSVVVSVVRPTMRRPALLVGAAAFGLAGILGILSIGVLFIVAAIVCAVVAERQTSKPRTVAHSAD